MDFSAFFLYRFCTIFHGTFLYCYFAIAKSMKSKFLSSLNIDGFYGEVDFFLVISPSKAQRSLARKIFARKFSNVFFSAPGDHESGLKIFLAKIFLAKCTCASSKESTKILLVPPKSRIIMVL